jgi:hypothetical protein
MINYFVAINLPDATGKNKQESFNRQKLSVAAASRFPVHLPQRSILPIGRSFLPYCRVIIQYAELLAEFCEVNPR